VKRKTFFRRRKFLAADIDSYVNGSVSVIPIDKQMQIHANLKLADCYRTIEWSFGASSADAKSIEAAQRKIDVIKQIILDFDEAFAKARAYIEALNKC
jgi:hypothetical protein